MMDLHFLGFSEVGIPLKLLVLNTQLIKIWNGTKRFCLMAMLYMNKGILVNSATFNDEETWFELTETAGRKFSFIHTADGFAEAATATDEAEESPSKWKRCVICEHKHPVAFWVTWVLIRLSWPWAGFLGKEETLRQSVQTMEPTSLKQTESWGKSLSQERITGELARENITWHFNLLSSPHIGGIFEVMVKQVKSKGFTRGNSPCWDRLLSIANPLLRWVMDPMITKHWHQTIFSSNEHRIIFTWPFWGLGS